MSYKRVPHKGSFRDTSSDLCYMKNKASIKTKKASDRNCPSDNKQHNKKGGH